MLLLCSQCIVFLKIFYYFLATPHSMWDLLFPNQGLNPHTLKWKCSFPTTRLLGKSCTFSLFFFFFFLKLRSSSPVFSYLPWDCFLPAALIFHSISSSWEQTLEIQPRCGGWWSSAMNRPITRATQVQVKGWLWFEAVKYHCHLAVRKLTPGRKSG